MPCQGIKNHVFIAVAFSYPCINLPPMDIKEFLQFPFNVAGITAPWISWVAAALLIIWPSYELYTLYRLKIQNEKALSGAIETINGLIEKFSMQGSQGRNAQVTGYLDKMFDASSFLFFPWRSFKTKLIRRESITENNHDQAEIWSSCSAATVYSEQHSFGRGFNKQRFVAIPGILTGIGLLFTFLAILIGLLDVKILDNKVNGLEGLIGGLSGKFISSIVALFSATIFLLVEKIVFYKMNTLRLSFIDALDTLLPVRTDAYFLNELCQTMKSQNAAFRTFNSDLSVGLRNNISESMSPILDRVVVAIDQLTEFTRGSQGKLLAVLENGQKTGQGVITENIEKLLTQLQDSLASSITEMSKEFKKSLTGGAQDQFTNVVDQIKQTAETLGGMNSQLTGTQAALKELIELSKISTQNQLTVGAESLENMVAKLGDSMSKIEERFAGLSESMRRSIEGSADKTSKAAEGILAKVGELNQQSVEKFMEVLSKHEGQLDRVDELKETLQSAVAGFGTYVTGYNDINAGMRSVAQDVKIAMNSLSVSVQKMKESQDSIKEVAELAASQVEKLNTSQEHQVETWKIIEKSMVSYREAFREVDTSASHLLSNITLNLQQFSSATQAHFNGTVAVANEHVAHAVGQLFGAIERLSEELEDFERKTQGL